MLTIGDFSRLSRITPRMLRHYDALGLLRPEEVGDNGYRYYRQEQLSDLMRIQWLKGYGFSLGEIGSLYFRGTAGPGRRPAASPSAAAAAGALSGAEPATGADSPDRGGHTPYGGNKHD